MKRFAVRFAVVAALGVAMVVFTGSSSTVANNAAEPSIKDVMTKVNKGKPSLCAELKGGVSAKEPKWDELATKAKELTPLAKALGANKPPKGDDASWKKFTDAYAKAAEDLEKAIGAKDAKAAGAAMKVISNCGGCHGAHK
ncbi:MAG: cytochrome C [Planctomycetes bacterium]|nr:cytochrome C [Planctomycetota bacterium]